MNLLVGVAAAIRGPMKKNFHTEIAKITKIFEWPERVTVQSKSVFLGDLCDLCVESLGGRGGRHSRTYEEEFSHGDRKDHKDFRMAGTGNGSIQIRIFLVIFATSVWNVLVDVGPPFADL